MPRCSVFCRLSQTSANDSRQRHLQDSYGTAGSSCLPEIFFCYYFLSKSNCCHRSPHVRATATCTSFCTVQLEDDSTLIHYNVAALIGATLKCRLYILSMLNLMTHLIFPTRAYLQAPSPAVVTDMAQIFSHTCILYLLYILYNVWTPTNKSICFFSFRHISCKGKFVIKLPVICLI